eukprot:381429-Rhodomonas_salina.1
MVVEEHRGRVLWSCRPCDPAQYVVNIGGADPAAHCQACPVGAGEPRRRPPALCPVLCSAAPCAPAACSLQSAPLCHSPPL